MVIVAQAYETGENLTSTETDAKPTAQDWCVAVKWYLDAFETPPLPLNEVDDFALDLDNYSLLAKAAHLYETGTTVTTCTCTCACMLYI